MSLVNIISAVGNNSSIYPLLVRDCGIEIPSKVAMTYQQNLKDSKQMAHNAVRERLIDEYGTSAIWLGGIPLMDWVCDKGIKKLGYDPKVNPNLFKEGVNKEGNRQGLKYNIEKFKETAPEQVKAMEKVLKNRKTFERLLAGKFILSTAIPVALMGYFLPKANFALTERIRQSQEKQKASAGQNVSFKGGASVLANMSTVNKMALTDGGLTVGRVATARNKYEKMEMAFKMLGMMFLNFVAPIWIAKGFDKLSNEKKIKDFQNEIEKFAKQARESGDIEKFAKKALKVKSGNILANVALSSFLLAVALPKVTFILRKKVTGSDAEPGLIKSN